MVKVLYDCQTPFGEGVVQTVHALKAISRGSRRFNHLAVRGWFRLDVSALVVPFRSFNHLAVRGWFRHAIAADLNEGNDEKFQSPRGEGVVQTANPQTCMVMRQTRI